MKAYKAKYYGAVKNKTYRHGKICCICRSRFIRGRGTKKNRIGWKKEIGT